MESKNCYNCSSLVSITANFCIHCGVAQKCKSCKTPISSKEQLFCSECGVSVKSDSNNIQAERNVVEFEQKGNNKKLSANFTNTAVSDLSLVLAAAIGNQYNAGRKGISFIGSSNVGKTGVMSLPAIEDAEIVTKGPLNQDAVEETLRRIFKEDNGTLSIIDKRVKEKSTRDLFIRLSVLFLYTHKLLGNGSVPKNSLYDLMNQEKLNDGNFRAWVAKENNLFVTKDDHIELRTPGEELAQQVIREINDGSYTPSKKASRSKRKQEGGNAKEGGTPKPNRPTATSMVSDLIKDKFFEKGRTVDEISKYCSANRGYSYSNQEINNALKFLLRKKEISREKNSEHKAYEYKV